MSASQKSDETDFAEEEGSFGAKMFIHAPAKAP
jgi:hypothetical protein